MSDVPFTHSREKLQLILDGLTLQELKITDKINEGGTTQERQVLRDRLKKVRALSEEVGNYRNLYVAYDEGDLT